MLHSGEIDTFEHYLAIGHNVGLEYMIDWPLGLAQSGTIELLPKNDATA